MPDILLLDKKPDKHQVSTAKKLLIVLILVIRFLGLVVLAFFGYQNHNPKRYLV